LDAGGAWSGITTNDTAGTASGNFTGTRWLINGGLTGTYPWQMLVLEPSLRVFAIWEHEKAFTDSLGTFQPARNFETGRASAGVKAIYPLTWTSSTVALSPYAGIYADYYFSKDNAQTTGLTTVPLPARLLGARHRWRGGKLRRRRHTRSGGEFGGIGSATHIWTGPRAAAFRSDRSLLRSSPRPAYARLASSGGFVVRRSAECEGRGNERKIIRDKSSAP